MNWETIIGGMIERVGDERDVLGILAAMLEACPECSVKRKDEIETLYDLAGKLADVVVALVALKGDGNET